MKSHTEYLTMYFPSGTYTNITERVQRAIDQSGVKEGIVLVNPKHAAHRARRAAPAARR